MNHKVKYDLILFKADFGLLECNMSFGSSCAATHKPIRVSVLKAP